MIKHILIAGLISIILLNPFNTKEIETYDLQSDAPSHKQWTKLLQKHVTDKGLVDYKGFKDDKEQLLSYTDHLSKHPPANNWSENEKKAYLINTYNAFTVLLIVDNYPVESIKDIGGFLGSPFSKKFIRLGADTYSLNDVEKGMLLKMRDARAHFAINCASYSCPKLYNKAFVASKLEQQLDEATHDFLQSDKNKINSNKLQLSKIFKWYASDFDDYSGSVTRFIDQYTNISISTNADIDYLDYNWNLNEQ